MIAVEQELRPGDPASVALGRTLVSQALAATGELATVSAAVVDDAVLATSELVTNAVSAARERICVVVEFFEGCARVAVYDDGPGQPRACPRTPDQPHGRGLSIVETVAENWGVRSEPPGKWVWADFPVALRA